MKLGDTVSLNAVAAARFGWAPTALFRVVDVAAKLRACLLLAADGELTGHRVYFDTSWLVKAREPKRVAKARSLSKRSTRRCSACGSGGHDRRTCGNLTAESES